MTFRESVERLLYLRRKSLLMADGAVQDTSRDVLHRGGMHKGSSPPRSNGAMTLDLEESFQRFVEVMARRVEAAQAEMRGNPAVHGDTKSKARKAETDAILGEEGKDPTEVAYLYRRTTEGIRKLRVRYGKDPDTGYSRDVKPLSAPAWDQYRQYRDNKS